MNFQQHMYVVDRVDVSGENVVIGSDLAVIIYVADAEIEVTVDRRTFYLPTDTILVIQAHSQIKINVLHGQYTIVRFRNYRLTEEGDKLIYEVDPLRFIHEFIWYRGVTSDVIEALETLQKSPTIYHFQTLLLKINSVYEIYERHGKEEAFGDVVHYVRKHAHHNLTRKLVAKRFGYNPNYFSESFKKETGWGFSEFLTFLRLEEAKIRLLSSTETVQDIARKVGYKDSLYLSRKFSQQIGMAPSKFRNHERIKNIATLQFTGAVLATGIKPSAALMCNFNVPDLLKPHMTDTLRLSPNWLREEVDWGEEKPDLIIASVHELPSKSYIQKLDNIAPAVALKWDTYDRLEEVRMIGRLIGRKEQAEVWIEQYERKIQEARYLLDSVLPKNTTIGVYELRNHNRIGIWRSNSRGAYNLFNMLKLEANPLIKQKVLLPDRGIMIEEAELPYYAADEMFVVVHCKEQEHRFFNEVWQSLPAMKRKKVHLLRLEDFWSSEGVALEEQLKIQMDYLLGKKISDICLY